MRRTPGKFFALGEMVQAQFLSLPQARQTATVLGHETAGRWGYDHGVNEHGVVVGGSMCCTRLPAARCGLTGPDIVRLSLERSPRSSQAVELITDLVKRHGTSPVIENDAADHVFLVADAREAFIVETCGPHWVCQQVREVRAAGDTCTIRQDWDRISVGLAGLAIERGWWPEDGTKLDFAGTLVGTANAAALRSWGRSTLLLEQQNGHIDVAFLRNLLSDQLESGEAEAEPPEETTLAAPSWRHDTPIGATETRASLIAQVSAMPGVPPLVWHAFGPPSLNLYFPLLLGGDMPPAHAADPSSKLDGQGHALLSTLRQAIGANRENQTQVFLALGRLQAVFDQETEEFLAEHAKFREAGNLVGAHRLAGLFMQHNWESFEEVVKGLLTAMNRPPIHSPLGVRTGAIAALHP
jgi:dipeptidase